MPLRLPSERQVDPRTGKLDFLLDPSPEHTRRSGEAMEALAAVLSSASQNHRGERHALVISHMQNNGMLSPLFYGGALANLDESGHFLDPMSPGQIVQFVVTLNQPVQLQIETVLTFLAQLVRRQGKIWQSAEQRSDMSEIDVIAGDLDERAVSDTVDTLRHGWRLTAETIAQQASEIGIRIEPKYRADPFPVRESLRKRLPQLKRIYNTFPTIRDAVDRTISAMSGREPLVIGGALPNAQRDFLQQRTSLMSVTKYVNHYFRDALVCGNGYLAFGDSQPLGVSNLRPEDVRITKPNEFAIDRDGVVETIRDRVLHQRGLKQIISPYGLSLLEIFLSDLRSYDVFADTERLAMEILKANSAPEQREWAGQMLSLAKRVGTEREKRFKEMLPGPFQMPAPEPGLFFEGFEKY